jgi:hypothetical protein
MEALEHRLSRYRSELTLRLLAILNAKSDEHGRQIVEVLSINRTLNSKIDSLGALTSRKMEETIAAVLTLQNGDMQTMTVSPTRTSLDQTQEGALQKTSVTYANRLVNAGKSDHEAQVAGFTRNTTDLAQRVLDALYFRSIEERHATIAKALERTYQWIYRDPAEHHKPWDSFVDWLESGRGCYWINGKAGSGKSTLMKYVIADPRTHMALSKWAMESELLILSFFFWNAGTALQKSQAGVLRSLLFKFLSSKPELIPKVFPGLCRALASDASSSLQTEISFYELKKGLEILFNEIPPDLKVCLFIDGIDEYEGDHSEISELFLDLATKERVKIVASSRPIPSCFQAFRDCPKLRLQDLTVEDIEEYVRTKLCDHRLMRELEATSDGIGTADELVHGIINKASGVFLWVILVVKSMIMGLENYDRRKDMLLRLDRLPSDLEKLYKHMLGSVSPEYQRQASIMLQLVMRSTDLTNGYDEQMTVLQLSYAEENFPSQAIDAPIAAISPKEEALRCKATEGRMRSRCCGLIESHNIRFHDQLRVGFLHRTVMEFLRDDRVWRDILDLTEDDPPDIELLLLSSLLREMKQKPPTSSTPQNTRTFVNMRQCLDLCVSIEQRKHFLQTTYLTEVYMTMYEYSIPSSERSHFVQSTWIEDCLSHYGWVSIEHQSVIRARLECPSVFLLLLTLNGSVKKAVQRSPELIRSARDDGGRTLLLLFRHLTHIPLPQLGSKTLPQNTQSIVATSELLDIGADPSCGVPFQNNVKTNLRADYEVTIRRNQSGEISAWDYLIWCTFYMNRHNFVYWPDVAQTTLMCSLFQKMLLSDAAIDVSAPGGDYSSAAEVIDKFLGFAEKKYPENVSMFADTRAILSASKARAGSHTVQHRRPLTMPGATPTAPESPASAPAGTMSKTSRLLRLKTLFKLRAHSEVPRDSLRQVGR